LNQICVMHRFKSHIVILLTLLCAFSACHPPQKTTAQAKDAPLPVLTTPQPTLKPAPTPQEAMDRGIAFLAQQPWEIDFVYMYSYLQPQFGWRDIPPQAKTAQVKDSLTRAGDDNALRTKLEMEFFERLLNPGFQLPAAEFSKASDVDVITLPALYCDVHPIDTATYFPKLRQELAYGGYGATHVLLSYLWLEERQCLSKPMLQTLRPDAVEASRNILGDRPIWSDIQLEAATLLRAIGEPIGPNWVEEIMANQHDDGGWQWNSVTNRSDTHATLLAIWFLAMVD
jgi:hypothetical protein